MKIYRTSGRVESKLGIKRAIDLIGEAYLSIDSVTGPYSITDSQREKQAKYKEINSRLIRLQSELVALYDPQTDNSPY